MPFMQESTCNRLPEAQMVLFPEFKHASHGFFPCPVLWARCFLFCGKRHFLDDRKQVFLQRHAARLRLGKQTGFDIGREV